MSHDETSGTVTRKERRASYGGKRKPVVRRPFSAANHVRNDWTPDELIMFLEGSAVGYNGMLRNYLCTAAAMLRDAVAEDLLSSEIKAAPVMSNELEVEVVERRDTPGVWSVEGINNSGDGEIYLATFYGPNSEVRAREYETMKYRTEKGVGEKLDKVLTEVAAAPANISKRNQQPGRLSGGEREALKKFVDNVVIAHTNAVIDERRGAELMDEAMTAGRAMLTKVRKRALGPNAAEELDPKALVDEVHANAPEAPNELSARTEP